MQHLRRWQTVLISLLLALTVLGIYWPVRHFDFVNLDDYDYVKGNPDVAAGLSWHGLGWALRTGHSGNWHPVTWLSHMVDAQLYGLNAGGHHVTNVLFHLANTILLFLLLKRMTGEIWPSALVAALFGLHPLHVESVAWVSERKDVLSMFFFMLTLFAYVKYAERERGQRSEAVGQRSEAGRQSLPHFRSSGFYALSLCLFALGLMSKPMLVTVPCVLLLLDWWPLGRFEWGKSGVPWRTIGRLTVEKIPFFILSLISSVVTVRMQHAGHGVASFEQFPFPHRVANAANSCLAYIDRLIWPHNLAPFYPYLGLPLLGRVVIAVALVVLVSVLVFRAARSRPVFAVGWLWYLGTLVPVIGLVQVGSQAMADRYTYIPSIGLFIMAAWAGSLLAKSLRSKYIISAAALAAVTLCTLFSAAQVKLWKNSLTLFQHTRQVTVRNYLACMVLGHLTAEEGHFDKALELFNEAAVDNSNYPDAQLYIGRALEKLRRYEEAANAYQKALQLKPGYAEAEIGLGSALAHQKQFPEAVAHYSRALELQPNLWEAEAGLGLALQSQGKFQESLPHMQRLVQLKPSNPDAHFTLGIALSETGQTNEARKEYNIALSQEPRMAARLLEDGQSLATAGDLNGAIARFLAALRLQPDSAETHSQLAMLFARQGRFDEATRHLEAALELKPDAQSHYNLALICQLNGRAREAVEHFQQALSLRTDWPEALNDLAWLLATHSQAEIRNGQEAVRLAEHACELTQYKEARFLGTLDAAYAETGRFQDALATAHKALDLASASGQREVVSAAQERIRGYEAQKPYRQK